VPIEITPTGQRFRKALVYMGQACPLKSRFTGHGSEERFTPRTHNKKLRSRSRVEQGAAVAPGGTRPDLGALIQVQRGDQDAAAFGIPDARLDSRFPAWPYRMSPVASVVYVQLREVLYRTKPELSNNALCAPPGSQETRGRTRSDLRPSWKSQEQSISLSPNPSN
jgi:hypothetical protein